MIFNLEEPIVACSTNLNANAAIALLRFSSSQSFDNLNPYFSKDIQSLSAREAHFCLLKDEEGNTLDEVVLTKFEAPKSYTGEYVLELGVHGNVFHVQKLLEFFTNPKIGFRLAREGEFTYRALKNGKLTLDQVEGLDLLLNAQSAIGLESGLSMMSGELHEQYLKLRQEFIQLRSSLELGIDFLEDVGEEGFQENFNKSLKAFRNRIESLNQRCSGALGDLMNPSIVLVGATNAGKSTLFNYLLKHERSIVSSVAGTTRDYVSEFIQIEGTNYRLIDTAGIRETADKIEGEGIDRSLDLMKKSFFKIFVFNLTSGDEFLVPEGVDLIIFTHFDLPEGQKSFENIKKTVKNQYLIGGPIGADGEGGSIGPGNSSKNGPMGAENSGPIGPNCGNSSGPMGAKTQSGPIEPHDKSFNINSLNSVVNQKYLEMTSHQPVMVPRQRELVNKMSLLTDLFCTLSVKEEDIAILSSELNIIGSSVDELLGVISPDEVLGNIFSNFCIGK